VIFVLVVWLKYALSDLKQKLDSFVVPNTLEEENQALVAPPPPVPYAVEETVTPQSTVAGLDVMSDVLREFMNVWEQHERLSEQERLQSGYKVQVEANSASSVLLYADARYDNSWDQELKRLVQVTSDTLHKFGISNIADHASEAKGKDAYDKASALLSFLKTYTTG